MSEPLSQTKGRIIHSKDRGIVYSVLKFCLEEARLEGLLFPLSQAQKRTSAATGVSQRTISRIRRQAIANPQLRRLKTPGRHRTRKKKDNVDDPDVPNKKKKKPVDSEATSTDENCGDFSIDSSSDPDPDVQVPPPPVASVALPPSSLIPKTEFMFFGKRSVDVNYFMLGLRRAIKHHKTLPCGFSDMMICEEAIKGDAHGIVFRCKMCLMSNTVWLEDPYLAPKKQATKVVAGDEEKMRNELYSMSGIKDFLLSKAGILPNPKVPISRKPEVNIQKQSNIPFVGQSQAPVILQSHVPLIGYPQVAPIRQAFLSSTTGVGTSSSFTNPALVQLKFCVEEPVKPVNISVKSTVASTKRRTSKRIALSTSAISKRHVSSLKSAPAQATVPIPTAKIASEEITVTPDVMPHSHTGTPSAPGNILFAPNPFTSANALPPQSGQSGVGSRTILLTPDDLKKILSAQNPLPSQGTTGNTLLPQGIFLTSGIQKTLQLPSAQSGPETEVPRSVLLPPSILVPLSQSTGSGTSSTATLPETITPDITTPDVLSVDLNLVKKEKDETKSVQFASSGIATTVPENITSDISTADDLSVDLNLVKKEIEES